MLFLHASRAVLLVLLAATTTVVGAFRFPDKNDSGTRVLQNPKHWDDFPAIVLSRGGGAVSEKSGDDKDDSSIDKTLVSAGIATVLLSILLQQIASRLSKKNTTTKPPEKSPIIVREVASVVRTIVPVGKRTVATVEAPTFKAPPNALILTKTLVSVSLTSLILMAVLYCANLPDVTKVYHNLGLPNKLFGVSPVLYAAFFFVTFSSSFVTDIVAGGVSADVVIRPVETPSSEWFTNLKKPSWHPPGWVFPIMWLLVSKPTQFLALREMFMAGVAPDWLALAVYCTHLALGNAWNDVFFRYRKIGLGLKVICIFWATFAISAGLFYQSTPWAGYWMLPTLGWVTIATTLNWSIYDLNKDEEK